MNNVGSKVSFAGLMIGALASACKILTYFGAIIFGHDVINDTYFLLNLAVSAGLFIALIGYGLKFLGERDPVDLITAAALAVSVVFIIGLVPYFGYDFINRIFYECLCEIFFIGLGINFMKKGNQAPAIIMFIMFAYFAVFYIVAIQILFGGRVGGIISYLISIFNGVFFTAALGLAAVTVVNEG